MSPSFLIKRKYTKENHPNETLIQMEKSVMALFFHFHADTFLSFSKSYIPIA